MQQNHWKYIGLFLLLGALFYLPFLGGVHLFDWDEVNFAEISREMLILDDYLRIYVDFKPFWEKPPFFFWTQALAMKYFGINEMAARIPNSICGLLTLMILFLMCKKIIDARFGYLWIMVYCGGIRNTYQCASCLFVGLSDLLCILGLSTLSLLCQYSRILIFHPSYKFSKPDLVWL